MNEPTQHIEKRSSDESLPILGSAASNLRFELVLNPRSGDKSLEGIEEPFAVLHDSGNFSKIYLARIAMGADATVRSFALKVQRNAYRLPASALSQRSFTNDLIERLWQKERDKLLRLSQTASGVAGLLDFEGAFGSQEKHGTWDQSLPVSFCKKEKVYFHPLCPECLSQLRDCRDESLLLKVGLPSRSQTAVRYIYCPSCAAAGPDEAGAVFYTYSLSPEEPAATRAGIRRRTELYRDLAAIFDRHGKEWSQAQEARLSRIFPCHTCKDREVCYPKKTKEGGAIPAESVLTPVSFYEFYALPLELLHLHYDDFIDLLGGASWQELKQEYRQRGSTTARESMIAAVDPSLSSSNQYIFGRDSGATFPVEVLSLKMNAFTQLCRGVREIHGRCREPHLDLKPDSVMAHLGSPGWGLPSLWNFKIKILDLGSAVPFSQKGCPQDRCAGIFWPPLGYQKMYTSPMISEQAFGHQETANLTLGAGKAEKQGPLEWWLVDADLSSEEIRWAEFSGKDLLRVSVHAPAQGLENLIIWGKLGDPTAQGPTLKGAVSIESHTTADHLKKAAGRSLYDAKVSLFKSYHIPCDLYSLGMILFRTVLVNKNQDMSRVGQAVQRIVSQLNLSQQEGKSGPDCQNQLMDLLKAQDRVFGKGHLFYDGAQDRAQDSAVSDPLWFEILGLGFALVTHIPGFSISAHHGDYQTERPESSTEQVLGLLEGINATLHSELFGAQTRNREIQEACDRVLSEWKV